MKLTDEERRKLLAAVPPDRQIIETNLAGIEPVQMRFLWWPYLPLGKVVIVAGAPGHGKSQLTALMAGMASRGNLYPGDVVVPARTLIMSAEDDLNDTVVPRLLAVNADLRFVDTMSVRTTYADGLVADGMIRVPGDVPAVYAYMLRHPDTRLIVLDPVASFFGRQHSTTVNQDVRDALDPLVAIAKRFGVTVVVVLHLNKSESRDFSQRIAESHGFQALARCVLALGPDPDDTDGERGSRKVLAITKANLAGAGNHAMRCEVRAATVFDSKRNEVHTSELVLTGKCEISADDLLIGANERNSRMEASDFLSDFVGDRWVKIGDIRKAALSDGHHWRTIERIRQGGGYQRAKQPGVSHGPWWIAKTDTKTPVPGTGGLGGLDGQEGSTPPTPPVGGAPPVGDVDNTANTANGANTANTANGTNQINLDEYRRERDRRLGERDDDD